MSEGLIQLDHDGSVAIVTLNRPGSLNALSRALVDELSITIKMLSENPKVRAVVLTGNGRAFSVGVDLKEMSQADDAMNQFEWHGPNSLFAVAGACTKPIISAVNGYAITGGLELALLGDFLIAADTAVFADTHARVGITPSWGMTQILPRLIGINRARQMSLTGEFVSADKALQWGLVNEVVAADTLMERALELGEHIASTDPITMGRIRRLITDGTGLPLSEAMALEAQVFDMHISQVSAADVAAGRERATTRGRQMADGNGKD
ncbi:enoyl-CoA hydratase [Falsiruegeria mediterranea]|uniref:Short-chain-enoyl-CoA hydratase n=1 Tax=Falsiruegeria mediterranea M17 TaxID=1200281 RepID=A0A2R8C8W8_9RHOB|nr:enoyl-CoA hydratase [Falsiruegeria mediterranea]SPJ28806.1 Short-chain-enoyl-CoA hydratase [Falsiruegeria mediterranea M17]